MSFSISNITVDEAVDETLAIISLTGTYGNGWSLNGNNITSDNFIGTLNNNPLVFKVNNKIAGKIDVDNNITNNTSIGVYSLENNSTGAFNSAFGNNSLQNNTIGVSNSAFGQASLLKNSTGSYNCSFGASSLLNNTIGFGNCAFGQSALNLNSTASFNSAFGTSALRNNIDGSYNTVIGYQEQSITGIFDNITAIGYNAELSITGSNQVRIGNNNIITASIQVGWTTSSDERLKSDIKDIDIGLNFINKLRPVSYYRNNDENKKTEYGLIAQELQSILVDNNIENNGIVYRDGNGFLGVRYNDFTTILIKAVQELKIIVEKQQEIIDKLKQKI